MSNRLMYGNYIDGFDQVKPHFNLMPEYGSEIQYTVSNPTSSSGANVDWYRFGPQDFTSDEINEYNLTEENFGAVADISHAGDNGWSSGFGRPSGYNFGESDNWAAKKTLGWDVDVYRSKITLTFPTIAQFGQKIRCRFWHTVRFKKDGGNWIDYKFPASNWSNEWDRYQYSDFGLQVDLEKTVGGGGLSGTVAEFVNDIKTIFNYSQSSSPEELIDLRGSETENNNWNQPIRPFLRHKSGSQSYDLDADLQSAAEMRLVDIQTTDSTFGVSNVIEMYFSPFGQQIGGTDPLPDGDCADNKYPLKQYWMADGTETTNLHVWYNGDYRDSTACGSCGSFRLPENYDAVGCGVGIGTERYDAQDLDYPANNWSGENDMQFTYSPAMEEGTIWEDSDNTNDTLVNNISIVDDASTFKSGAWHRFGLVYYDEKGRSSTVMLNEPTPADPTRNSSVYVGFPAERKYKQELNEAGEFEYTNTALSNAEKLQPADIAWKIFHKPPVWAEYYHWVYARNSSIGEFMQFMVDAAYVNKGAKAGTSQAEAGSDSKIYISLNTMDGRPYSYGERNRSLVGKWSFAEGDRIRILTDNGGNVMTNPDSGIQTYYDFKISEIGHYPGRFDYDPNQGDIGDDGSSSGVVRSPDSPAGGQSGDPKSAKPGKFIILDDPKLTGLGVNNESQGEIASWAGIRVEIYRPKKNTNEELSMYFEFSERYKINNAGTEQRVHYGGSGGQNQAADSSYMAGDNVDSTTPATGRFRRGDVWYKSRDLSTASVSVPGQFFEDYFLNDFMQTNHTNIGRPHIPSPYAKALRRKATITYSDVYQPDTQYNGLHSFNFSQRPYMDYDLTWGSVQKLIAKETNLVMMQENKCSTLMISKGIINSPDGDAGLTLATDILPQEQVLTGGDYGPCTNPESVAFNEGTIYFIDIRRGAAIRIGGDGITVISDYKMKDFFRDKMDLYENILPSQYNDRLNGGLFILGGYDRRHGEYYVTFPNVYETSVGTENEQLAFFSSANTNFETNSLREDGSTTWNINDEIVRDNQRNAVYDEDITVETRDGGRRVLVSNKAETLAFNEQANKWTSFYTFYPDYYAVLNRIFITFKNGVLYKHDMDATHHTMFYEKPYPDESIIEFPFNGDVSSVKTWNNLTIEGSDRQEVIPLINTSTTGGDATVTATTGSANLEAINISYKTNDIAVGDSLWYNDNGTLRTLGVVTAITDADTIVTSVGEVNAFITASSTSSGAALFDVFVITADTTMYRAKFETNINATEISHRTSYNNTISNAGGWVTREEVASTHIPLGNTNTSGGEYFGLGTCSSDSSSPLLTGVSFLSAGLQPNDRIYYDNNGTETEVGLISSITDTEITLNGNASATLNTFMFVKKNALIDGDRLKGHYMLTRLTKRTKDKVHLFTANANVINSELTNK